MRRSSSVTGCTTRSIMARGRVRPNFFKFSIRPSRPTWPSSSPRPCPTRLIRTRPVSAPHPRILRPGPGLETPCACDCPMLGPPWPSLIAAQGPGSEVGPNPSIAADPLRGPLNPSVSPSSFGPGRITFGCRLWFARNRVSDQPSAQSRCTRNRGRAVAGRRTGVASERAASIALAPRGPLPRVHPVPAKAPHGGS